MGKCKIVSQNVGVIDWHVISATITSILRQHKSCPIFNGLSMISGTLQTADVDQRENLIYVESDIAGGHIHCIWIRNIGEQMLVVRG